MCVVLCSLCYCWRATEPNILLYSQGTVNACEGNPPGLCEDIFCMHSVDLCICVHVCETCLHCVCVIVSVCVCVCDSIYYG